jgi:hypothetical protein
LGKGFGREEGEMGWDEMRDGWMEGWEGMGRDRL